MKRHTCCAFLVALTASTFAFAEGPIDGEVYGRINISLDKVDREDDVGTPTDLDEWQLNSNASRFGFKGETVLDGSLSVIYQVEWEVDVDADETDLGPRNRFIGLKGEWGTILAGRHDTPTKLIGKRFDLFNDLFADIRSTFEGENRISNIVMYTAPTFSNVTATVMFIPGEDSANGNDGINDGVSVSVEVDLLENLYLGLSVDRDVDGQDLERLVVQYTVGDFVIAGLFQQNEDDIFTQDESGFAASVAYTVGANTFKFQAGQIDNDAPGGTFADEESITFGYDRKLGDNTTFFSYLTMDEDSVPGADDEFTVIGAGIEHRF